MAAVSVTWLITGTSRGIGLELVRQLLASPSNIVVATCRTPEKATALQALKQSANGSLKILPLDTSSKASMDGIVQSLSEALGTQGLDYLINNAAISSGDDRAFDFEYTDFMKVLQTNIVGPAYLAQVLLPFLEKGSKKTIVNYASGLASIGLDFGAKTATYSVTKAAVNMLTYKQKTARPDFIAIAVDPGWVKTDMGGHNAMLEPQESVEGVLKVVAGLKISESGKFFRYDGVVLPW